MIRRNVIEVRFVKAVNMGDFRLETLMVDAYEDEIEGIMYRSGEGLFVTFQDRKYLVPDSNIAWIEYGKDIS